MEPEHREESTHGDLEEDCTIQLDSPPFVLKIEDEEGGLKLEALKY